MSRNYQQHTELFPHMQDHIMAARISPVIPEMIQKKNPLRILQAARAEFMKDYTIDPQMKHYFFNFLCDAIDYVIHHPE